MSLWEKFSTGANKGYDESINVLKGEKSIPKAMEDIKRDLGKNDSNKKK